MIIMDILSTNQGAYRLVKYRLEKINKIHKNYLVCPYGIYTDKMKKIGIPTIDFEVKRNGYFSVIQEIRNLMKIFEEYNPDIVHSHNSKTGAISRLAGFIYNKRHNRKIKIIHQVHGYHFTSIKGLKRMIYATIERELAKITDILLFQNNYEYNLSKDMGMDKYAKLIYIGNGICFDEFKRKKTDNIKFICVSVCRVEEVKNQSQIIEALSLIINSYKIKNIKIYFIGEKDKDYFNQLKKMIHVYRLEEYVEFTGMIDREELVQYFNIADLSILTSLKEGKPRNIMESMYMGVSCIGTNVIGTNELIIDGATGYLVDINNIDSLAQKIIKIMDNNSLRMIFSNNAFKYAENNFDENKVIDILVKIYEKR